MICNYNTVVIGMCFRAVKVVKADASFGDTQTQVRRDQEVSSFQLLLLNICRTHQRLNFPSLPDNSILARNSMQLIFSSVNFQTLSLR